MQEASPMDVVTCAIDMHFATDEVDGGLKLLLSSVGITQATRGCQTCVVARDAADATRIHYRETWESQSEFLGHARSEEFRRVLVAMDMCCEEPKVVIGNFSGRTGITHLQELCDRPPAPGVYE